MTERAQGAPQEKKVRILIMGAGLSGICTGIQLRRKQLADFVILEKGVSAGGTWRENTYPGIACDVPSPVYSLSFEQNPDWTHNYPSGGELWAYCERCIDKYNLLPHIRWETEVASADFEDGHWVVKVVGGDVYHADVLVSGLGGLHYPNHADIAGIEQFQGPRFHTARWDHEIDLRGKKVAIIGTGASGTQVLPAIAEEVDQVTMFQRSAAWVLPRMAREISRRRRRVFQRFPILMRLYRRYLWLLMDVVGVLSLREGGFMNKRTTRVALDHLEASVVDETVRRKLTPEYTMGCKRRIVSDDYLSTFNRSNVHLVTDAITSIDERGIYDATGTHHKMDIIIEATGFRPFDIASYVDITGRNGQPLKALWEKGIYSFRTLMVPGFPNFFMLLGPNSGTGHTSALIMIESQVQYMLKCLDMMEKDQIKLIDPKPAFTQAYNGRLQRDMQRMVFNGGCNAWYTDAEDRNFTLWPYSATRFLWELRRPRKEELLLS